MKRFFSVFAVLFLFSFGVAVFGVDNSTVFYTEDFRHYRNASTACVDDPGIVMRNDPIWWNTAGITCNLSRDSAILRRSADLRGKQDVEVLFQFKLLSADSRFALVFRDNKQRKLTIMFNAEGVSAVCPSLKLNAEGKYTKALRRNSLHLAAVTMEKRRLTVYVDENRVYRKVLSATLPAMKFADANFFGFKKNRFYLAEIVFRRPAPLPNNSIRRLLPAAIPVVKGKPGPLEQVLTVDKGCNGIFKTGTAKNAVRLQLFMADKAKPLKLNFFSAPVQKARRVRKGKRMVNEYHTLIDDAFIDVRVGSRRTLAYYIRPFLRRYKGTVVYGDILRDQALLPKASEHPLKVAFRNYDGRVELYLDGRYARSFSGTLVKLQVSLAAGAELVQPFEPGFRYDKGKYTLLDISAQAMAKTAVNAKISLKPGFGEVDGIPMLIADGAGSADIGLTRQGRGSWGLEVDEYLRRSPFDGLLTEVHFTVPRRPYDFAYVLCAVDPDPAKDPVLTVRMTQYKGAGVGNNCLADTHIVLPRAGEPLPAGVHKVGEVELKGKKVPLYLVRVALDLGKVTDIVMDKNPKAKDYLNIDFFGKPWSNFEQLDKTSKPDPNSTSAIQIFGATLEKSPVGITFEQTQPSNVFAGTEKPETIVVFKSFAPFRGTLNWEISNSDGRKIDAGSRDVSLAESGLNKKEKIAFKIKKPGWYQLKFSLKDANGKLIFSHSGSLAILAADKRQAGVESPFGTWWFDGTHGAPSKLDFAGPTLRKAGIRQVSWTGKSGAALKPWKLFRRQVSIPFRMRAVDNMLKSKDPAKAKEAMFAAARKKIDAYLKKYPTVREAVVFHESGPGNALPAEVLGLKPVIDEKRRKLEKRYANYLNVVGEFLRKYYPDLKLMVGNTSSSASCIAAVLRNGGKSEYIDYIGIETPAQVILPEKFQEWGLLGFRMTMELAKIMSGKDIPATGCYEFTYRADRDMGEQQQAEWYMRDVLISLAAGFTRIGPGIFYDVSNNYYNGLWGGSGMLRRGPYGYPKKSYVAYAVLTDVFDRVKFSKKLPTGSATVYALEFKRADGKNAYAFWAARGAAELKVEFNSAASGRAVTMYGITTPFHRKMALKIKASTAPAYIVVDKPVKSVVITSRSFPKDMARAEQAKVAAPLDNAAAVEVVNDPGLETELKGKHSFQTPIYKQGKVKLSTVKDKEKGECLEVTLDKSKNQGLNKYITEYAYLKLKKPAAIKGDPVAVGVWVKGDSNWGRIMFELEDAEGEIWRSTSTGGWGCDILDWPGNISVNFDGWNYVALPLRDTKLFNDHSPGPVLEQWVSNGKGDKKMTLPLKLRGLIIEMNRKPLQLTDWRDAACSILLKDAGGVYDKK